MVVMEDYEGGDTEQLMSTLGLEVELDTDEERDFHDESLYIT